MWNVGILLQIEQTFTNAHLSRVGLQNDPSLSLVRCFNRLSCTPLPLPSVLFVLTSNLFPMHFWMYLVENPGSNSGLPMHYRFPPNSQCNNFRPHLLS